MEKGKSRHLRVLVQGGEGDHKEQKTEKLRGEVRVNLQSSFLKVRKSTRGSLREGKKRKGPFLLQGRERRDCDLCQGERSALGRELGHWGGKKPVWQTKGFERGTPEKNQFCKVEGVKATHLRMGVFWFLGGRGGSSPIPKGPKNREPGKRAGGDCEREKTNPAGAVAQ